MGFGQVALNKAHPEDTGIYIYIYLFSVRVGCVDRDRYRFFPPAQLTESHRREFVGLGKTVDRYR